MAGGGGPHRAAFPAPMGPRYPTAIGCPDADVSNRRRSSSTAPRATGDGRGMRVAATREAGAGRRGDGAPSRRAPHSATASGAGDERLLPAGGEQGRSSSPGRPRARASCFTLGPAAAEDNAARALSALGSRRRRARDRRRLLGVRHPGHRRRVGGRHRARRGSVRPGAGGTQLHRRRHRPGRSRGRRAARPPLRGGGQGVDGVGGRRRGPVRARRRLAPTSGWRSPASCCPPPSA